MTHSYIWAMPAAVLLTLASCKKDSAPSSDNQVASLLFDANSPAAREALATTVSFRITDENYAQWEKAQRFLDALPRSAFVSASGTTGNAIDRAVATLEASPRARTAIERTGLSVRDFVLETVALAQAAEAGSGQPPNGVIVSAENIQFVQRYQSRILQARAESRAMRARADAYSEADTMGVGVQAPAPITPEAQRAADILTGDSARLRQSDSVSRERQQGERSTPPPDTVRDTIPTSSQVYYLRTAAVRGYIR